MNLVFCTAPAEQVMAAVDALLPGAPKETIVFAGAEHSPLGGQAGAQFISWGNGPFSWPAAAALWRRLNGIRPAKTVLPLNNNDGAGYATLRVFSRLVTDGQITEYTKDGMARPLDESVVTLLFRPEERWHAAAIAMLELARPFLGFSGKDIPDTAPGSGTADCATVRETEQPATPAISVVIRTFNEEELVGKTLAMVFSQKEVDAEVIVIDSGSTDNTVEICERFPTRIFSIPKNAFSYGAALNLGARLARGTVVVNLSAHAVPANVHWLKELTAPLAEPRVAAVFGRELPMDGRCGHFERKILTDSFGPHPSISTGNPFFSNANAAITKQFLVEFPFDERAAWAEDQLWAHEAQRRGYAIRYQSAAAVYHSHALSMEGNFTRCYKYHRAMFGTAWKGRERQVRRAFRERLARRSVSFRKFLTDGGHMGPLAAALYAPYCEYVNYLGCREAAINAEKGRR